MSYFFYWLLASVAYSANNRVAPATTAMRSPVSECGKILCDSNGIPLPPFEPTFDYAISHGLVEKIREYKAQGQKPTLRDIERAIYKRKPVILAALVEDMDLSRPEFHPPTGNSLLCSSIMMDKMIDRSRMPLTQSLLENGARPTPEHIFDLVFIEDYRVLEFVLPKFNEPFAVRTDQQACRSCTDPRILALLLKFGMKTEMSHQGISLLAQTVMNKDYVKTKLLLEAGANPNDPDPITKGIFDPFEEALAPPDRIGLVYLLLKYGAVLRENIKQKLPENKRRWLELFTLLDRFRYMHRFASQQGYPTEIIKAIFSRLL